MIFKFWLGCAIGLGINILLIYFFKKTGKLLLFLTPYILFILMSEFGYIAAHHIGLLFIFYIFAFWCVYQQTPDKILSVNKKMIILLKVFIFLCIGMQLYWSCCAFVNEINKNYSSSREMVKYIKQYNLDKYKMISYWNSTSPVYENIKTGKLDMGEPFKSAEEAEKFAENYVLNVKRDLNDQRIATVINQYFNRNLFYNFNIDKPDKQYTIWQRHENDYTENMKKIWQGFGYPEIIAGNADVNWLFDDDNFVSDNYYIFKVIEYGYVWKNQYLKTKDIIFVRKDIMEKLIKENHNSKETNS